MGSNIPFSASAQRTLDISPPTPYPYLKYAQSAIQFDPLLIQGCELWLDAADQTTLSLTGSTVTAWRDKSTKSYTITVNSTPTYLTTGFNGELPSVSFTTGVYLQTTLASPVANSDFAMFAVWNQTTDGGVNSVLSIGAPGTETALGIHAIGSTSYYNLYHFAVGDASTSQIYTYGVPVVHSGTLLSGVLTAYINGTASGNTVNDSANTGTSFYISQPSGFPIIGQVAEVLLYTGTLTSTQRQQIEGYLASKWKLRSYLSPTQLYNAKSYLSVVNARVMPTISIRRAAQRNRFLPPQYSNCVLWLDAADRNSLTLSGTNVTQWNDKSGVENHVVNANITGTLTYSTEARTISTDGTSYFYAPVSTQRATNTNFQLFMVYTWLNSGSSANQALWGGDQGGWNRLQLLNFPGLTGDSYILSWGNQNSGTAPNGVSYTGLNTASQIIYQASYNGFTTNGSALYINGVNQGAFTDSASQGSPNPILTNTWFSAIGPETGGQYPSQIAFNEIIIYTTTLSHQQRQQIEGYLAWKWGLKNSIGQGHPFFLSPPVPVPFQ